jgi:uncharacterized damage-inducible protein DinB
MATTTAVADLRYPIGKFQRPASITAADRARYIAEIAAAPARFRAAVKGLSPAQLDTPYRPGGWSVRQVVHHVPDSHMNSYMRFKLALTEDRPAVKGYDEARWAELADSRETPVEVSLALLENIHQRWLVLLRSLSDADFKKAFVHSEMGELSLEQTLALYAWHGAHHTAHITSLRQREGWK